MDTPLRVLVIGAGTMGKVHSRVYTTLPTAQLIGIVDPFEWDATLARDLGVLHYQTFEEVPSDAYDAVDVCVPSRWHREYVVRAAALGKAVFCEKPIALNLTDAREMIEACAQANVRFTVGHCVRFFPESLKTKAILDEKILGDITMVRTFRGGRFPRGWNDWYANRHLSGGTLVDLVIHDFDFLRWVLGPVERVYARNTQDEMNRLDVSTTLLRFACGAMAHVEGSWAHQGFATRFEWAGTLGLLTHDSADELPLTINRMGPDGERVALPASASSRSPYYLEIEHFVEAVQQGLPLRVSPSDAYEALKVALAARQSAETGLPVWVRDVVERSTL